jgi:hypothetical protein
MCKEGQGQEPEEKEEGEPVCYLFCIYWLRQEERRRMEEEKKMILERHDRVNGKIHRQVERSGTLSGGITCYSLQNL